MSVPHCKSEPTDIDQIYKVLKQAGEISGGPNKNLSSATGGVGAGGGGGGGVAAVSGGETSFVQAVLKLKNSTKIGATGSSTLAGTVTAALAQQQQSQEPPQHPLPDINVINVPEYPERISRRGVVGGVGAPIKAIGTGNIGGLQQTTQQNKGLAAPLADISSSGPNGKHLIFKSLFPLLNPLLFSDVICSCVFRSVSVFAINIRLIIFTDT